MSIGYPWISDAKEKNYVFYQAKKYYPTWQGIAGHFAITGKLGEPNRLVCIWFVTKPTKPSY